MSFKSGVKGRGSDRWREWRWWLWWGDMRRMRWTRRRVNTLRLTEWRRELIPQVRWRTKHQRRLLPGNDSVCDNWRSYYYICKRQTFAKFWTLLVSLIM